MTDLDLASSRGNATRRPKSAFIGALGLVVLFGATTASFALQACAENTPAQPVPPAAPSTTASSSAKAPTPPPPPSPSPNLPPPPT